MKVFRVYKHPTQGLVAVKVGFSWPAIFFGFFWMLVKRLWGIVALWFLGYLAMVFLEAMQKASGDGVFALVMALVVFAGYLGLWLVPGFKGNAWRETNLAKRGYEVIATVQAATPDAALANGMRAMKAQVGQAPAAT